MRESRAESRLPGTLVRAQRALLARDAILVFSGQIKTKRLVTRLAPTFQILVAYQPPVFEKPKRNEHQWLFNPTSLALPAAHVSRLLEQSRAIACKSNLRALSVTHSSLA